MVFILAACSTTTPPDPTPMLTATAAPTSTITPTSSITPSPTNTPSSTPVPNGPCDNPLVPLATGNQWHYRATTDSGEFLYTLKALEISDGSNIVVIVEFNDQTRGDTMQEPVVCQNGAIDNFPLFWMDMHFSNYLDQLFDTYHESGAYVPGYATFVENNWKLDWQSEYLTEIRVSVKNPLGGSNLHVVESSPIDLSFLMDGSREGVTVPARNFPQAIKVAHSFSMVVTLTQGTSGTGGTLIINTTQWYEPYVGLIRSQVDSALVNIGGQEFSAPFHSVVELVEFTSGQ